MPSHYPILLVDDNPHLPDILNRAASSRFSEAQFIAVGSYEEAVAYLEGLRGPGPRLILLDIHLRSEKNGLDLLKRLRQHPQGRIIPIVVLTAAGPTQTAQQSYLLGANAFTIKPHDYDGWKKYVQELRAYWYEVVTLPRLWFEGEREVNQREQRS